MASAASTIAPSCAVALVDPEHLVTIDLNEAKLAGFSAANMDFGRRPSKLAITFMRTHHSTVPGADEGTQPGAVVETRRTGTK